MILLDALHINNGGGKVLLDYLIAQLEADKKNIFYLLDARVRNNIPSVFHGQVKFLSASLFQRWRFYWLHGNKFSKILCFGDIAPTKKTNAKVYTYMHQPLYIAIPNGMPLGFKVLFRLKRFIFTILLQNTNYLIVQNEYIREQAIQLYGLSPQKVKCIPFFPSFQNYTLVPKVKHSYIYISDGPPHKNHIRLISAFCKFFDTHKIGSLVLTVSSDFEDLIELIASKQNAGYPIMNIGFIKREALANWYSKTEYLIFPSLAESFGLGLIEATKYNCKIIASDLPYVHQVCKPSLTFNPESEKSIIKALVLSINCNVSSSGLVTNQIHELTNLLS